MKKWVSRILSESIDLPNISKMKLEIEIKKQELKNKYLESDRHTIQVDFLEYMDDIASIIEVIYLFY
jgi:dimethylaniline monooxygenase (N-oxide forming)